MKLVDKEGNEITSKQNENAQKLEKELAGKAQDLLEPLLNRIQLSGGQLPQQQLMQLSSMAHQMLFNRMVYNLAIKAGVENIDELLGEDDVKELQTSLNNQIKMVDQQQAQQQQGEQDNENSDN